MSTNETARPLSPNEAIKAASRLLRGTIADGLQRVETGGITDDDAQLTKFHGIYLQDDRDLRAERGRKKLEKAFAFMARLRVPGGVLTPAQWLAADRIARERGNRSLRLTTRQTIQFHGIIKSNLRAAIQGLNDALLDTIAACGDVNRNVVARVNPWQSRAHTEVAGLAQAIAAHLLPTSRAWHEIFIDGEQVSADDEEEPIYGRTYLPRKFKIAVALPPSNDVDVFAHDLGFIAIVKGKRIAGYNVVVGGGMGMTHGEPDTFPRTGDVIGFCLPDQAVAMAEHVVTVQRDFGDRSDRKHARLKYTIERLGLPAFVAELENRLGHALAPARAFAFTDNGDRPGWTKGDDGAWHFCLFVENGRVQGRALDGLRAIAERGIGRFVLTPNQNLVLANIPADQKAAVAELLQTHALDTPPGALRRNAMACVALPTCGLALAEAERFLPDLVTRLEDELDRSGLAQADMTIRMTGCPNGCARPYLAEIGLVGRSPGLYNLYLGAAHDGTRLNKLYRKDVGADAIVAALAPLFHDYATHRSENERFGDYVIRAGHVHATTSGKNFHADLAAELRS